jgi:hypothetical protein
MAGFRPLRQRLADPDAEEVLSLTVPSYMIVPIIKWMDQVTGSAATWDHLALLLRLTSRGDGRTAVHQAVAQDRDLLLDLVDARLSLGTLGYSTGSLRKVQDVLTAGGSGWRVTDELSGLQQVVDPTLSAVVKDATSTAESASEHLARAWAETYSKTPNPTLAHAEMIKAVECAAARVLTPKDPRATLGTLIGQISNQGHLYATAGSAPANDGVEVVHQMMRVLWEQQTDRHGATTPTVPATQQRVEFLVPIAAALVHAFEGGRITRV